jgi:hypothetical protein
LNDSTTVHGAIAVLFYIRAKQSTFGNFKKFKNYFSGNKLIKEVKYWKNCLKKNKLEIMYLD